MTPEQTTGDARASGGLGRIAAYTAVALQALIRRSGTERGQTLVEYSLIVAVFAIALVTLLTLIGGDIDGFYRSVNDRLESL